MEHAVIAEADARPAASAGVADEAVLPESNVAGECAEGGGEVVADDEWDGEGGDEVAKVINVYATILDELKDRIESQDDAALYLKTVNQTLADIAECQDGSQHQANTYIAETHRLLHQWCFLPEQHPLHRLEKEYTRLIADRRQRAGLRKQPRKRWAAWKNPRPPRDSAEANRVIYRVVMEVMDKLSGLADRGCIEYHLVVVNKYKGNMQLLGESKGLKGLGEVLQVRTCVDAFRRLCAQQQRVANLGGIQGVTFSKLDAAEQRSAINVILAVVAPTRQQICPFKPARKPAPAGTEQQPPAGAAAEQADVVVSGAEKLWSQHYFAWPAGLPYVSVSNQTEGGLLQLFEAASAAVGLRWPQVLYQARKALDGKLPGSCERVLEALSAVQRIEAARARTAQPIGANTDDRDAAEPLLGEVAGGEAAHDGVAGTPLSPHAELASDCL